MSQRLETLPDGLAKLDMVSLDRNEMSTILVILMDNHITADIIDIWTNDAGDRYVELSWLLWKYFLIPSSEISIAMETIFTSEDLEEEDGLED